MQSEIAIAEDKIPVVSPSLDYDKYSLESSAPYKYYRVDPRDTAALTIAPTATGQQLVFDLPTGCMNLSESYLSFDFSIAATGTANTFNGIYTDTIGPFQRIIVQNSQSQDLLNLTWAALYAHNAIRREVKVEQLRASDSFIPAPTNAGSEGEFCPGTYDVYQTNTRLRTGDAAGTPFTDGRAVLGPGEPAYLVIGPTANTGVDAFRCRIPFNLITNTILSMNKTMYVGETLTITFVLDGSASFYVDWLNTGVPSASDSAGTLSNAAIYLAQPMNEDLKRRLMMTAQSGQDIDIPYIVSSSSSITNSTSHSVEIKIRPGDGKILKKLWWIPVQNVTPAIDYYNHNNVNILTVAGLRTTGYRIADYQSFLNGQAIENSPMRCTAPYQDDWKAYKNKYLGTATQTARQHYYNWAVLVDFSEDYSALSRPMLPDTSNMTSGLPIGRECVYSIRANTGAAGAQSINHYFFAVMLKKWRITATGLVMVQ
jgi:hypothetical protein